MACHHEGYTPVSEDGSGWITNAQRPCGERRKDLRCPVFNRDGADAGVMLDEGRPGALDHEWRPAEDRINLRSLRCTPRGIPE